MTTPLLIDLLWAVVGLVLLTVGADLLVRGASGLATRLGVPPLIVGLTVVAFGTSAPELAVSIDASLAGSADVALGNVVGSNIFNILLVLGASALVAPLTVKPQLARLDVPVMVGVAVIAVVMCLDLVLSRGEGVVLLLLLGVYLFLLWRAAQRGRALQTTSVETAPPVAASAWVELLFALGGLALLVFGADALVEGATSLARAVGVSELVVGLTVVAAGTSLPELATSVVASLRGERDLAVGNVVGSNIFNVLSVLGASATVAGGMNIAPGLLHFDFPVMIAVSLACLPVFMTGTTITRGEGGVFVAYYALYATYLGLHTAEHPFREEFGVVVLGGVVPLTLAIATIFWMRGRRNRAAAPAD